MSPQDEGQGESRGLGKQTILGVLLAAILAVAFWGWQQEEDVPDPPPGSAPTLTDVATEPAPAGPTKAKADLASVIGENDYPLDAIRRGEEGATGFRLSIDQTGRVTACEVTQSSGSASLDAATCRVFRARARFTPATDRAGRPTTDTFSSRVRWVLPAP